jgi:hypothetical protein
MISGSVVFRGWARAQMIKMSGQGNKVFILPRVDYISLSHNELHQRVFLRAREGSLSIFSEVPKDLLRELKLLNRRG